MRDVLYRNMPPPKRTTYYSVQSGTSVFWATLTPMKDDTGMLFGDKMRNSVSLTNGMAGSLT